MRRPFPETVPNESLDKFGCVVMSGVVVVHAEARVADKQVRAGVYVFFGRPSLAHADAVRLELSFNQVTRTAHHAQEVVF